MTGLCERRGGTSASSPVEDRHRLARRVIAFLTLIAAGSGSGLAQLAPRIPLVGYSNRSGKVVEPAIYQDRSMSSTGDRVAVFKEGKAGYLNLRTRVSTGIVFDQVADDHERSLFADGPESVQAADQWGSRTKYLEQLAGSAPDLDRA